jgi:hypothetical protein
MNAISNVFNDYSIGDLNKIKFVRFTIGKEKQATKTGQGSRNHEGYPSLS